MSDNPQPGSRRTHIPSSMSKLLSPIGASTCAFFAGALAFFAIIGWAIFVPGNVGWLAHGDAAAMYLGWLFFRGEPWHLPLTAIAGYGDGLGASVITSDSIPGVALVLKALHGILPEPFQYFGPWLALGFALQGLFAALILRRLQVPPAQQVLGALLVVMSPLMISRAIENFALANHWELLAAIYLYHLDARKGRTQVAWIALLAIASLTNAYIFALVGSVWGAALVQWHDRTREAWRSLLVHGVAAVAFVSLLMWLAGYAKLAAAASTGGFGHNQLNLLAWINPRGLSAFFATRPIANADQGEGIQYLGAGALLICAVALASLIVTRRPLPFRARPWAMLLVVALFWLAFAVSHRITIGSRLLLEVPLPQSMLVAAGVFRASGRMAWLASYLVILAAIAWCALKFPRHSVTLLAAACVLQWLDIAPLRRAFDTLAATAHKGNPADCGPLAGPPMPVTLLPEVRVYGYDTDRLWDLAVCAGRRSMPINSAYISRHDEARYLANAKAVDRAMTNERPRADRYYAYRNEAVPAVLGLPKGFGTRVGEFRVFTGADALAALAAGRPARAAARAPDAPWSYRLQTRAATAAPDFLLSGWSHLEPGGVWSDGPVARMLVPVPEGYASLTSLSAFVHAYGANDRQSVEVAVNGLVVGTWEFKSQAPTAWKSLQVPAQAFEGHEGYAVIEFRIAAPVRPQSTIVVDRRELGLFLSEIRLDTIFADRLQALTFAEGGNGIALLESGWSWPEPWGIWSDGDVATLRIGDAGKPRPERLRFLVQASSPTGTQRITVRIDGKEAAVWTIRALAPAEWHEVKVPGDRTSRAPLRIEFVPDTPGPPPIPGTQDARRLGIGLSRIEPAS